MPETPTTISEWALDTFGPVLKPERGFDRADEEYTELRDAVAMQEDAERQAEEAADVFIVFCHWFASMGVDFGSVIDRKMAKNRGRRWRANGDGTGYHIKDPA